MEQMLYTVAETSKILKTNSSYVYNLIKLGFLPAIKLGSYKIRKSTLENFLQVLLVLSYILVGFFLNYFQSS